MIKLPLASNKVNLSLNHFKIMITSEIKRSRVLKKITLGASVAVMAVGLVASFGTETQAEGSGGGGTGGTYNRKAQYNYDSHGQLTQITCPQSGDNCRYV